MKLQSRKSRRLSAGFQALSCVGACVLSAGGVQAQVPDQQLQDQGVRMMLEHLRNIERAQPAPRPAPAPLPQMNSPQPAVPALASVTVTEIRFSRSQLLPDEALQAVAQRYVGRTLGTPEIRQLLQDVEQLYRDLGLLTAMPVLPQQDLASGVLRILLVEGRLGQVRVQTDAMVDSEWVQRWFDIEPGTVITGEEVRRRLALFNTLSDYSATTSLVAGDQFGQTDLQIEVPRAPLLSGWAGQELSSTREGLVPNLFSAGFRLMPTTVTGGRFDMALIRTGLGKTVTAALGMPVGVNGWRMNMASSVSQADKVLSLPIKTESRSLSWDVGKTWVLSAPWVLGTTAGVTHFHTRTEVNPVLESSTDRLSMAATLNHDIDSDRRWLRVSFNAGSSSNHYSFVEGVGQWRRSLDARELWSWRMAGVVRVAARETASSFDRFYLGGMDTVRGFEIGSAAGDEGAALQTEMRRSVSWFNDRPGEAFAFVDAGQARNNTNGQRRSLASTGLGLQTRLDDLLALELLATRQVHSLGEAPTRFWMRLVANF